MSFISSVSLIVAVIIIYYALIKFFSVLFRITGIPKERAAFQSVSLLTNAGYTTAESEIIVSEKTRRSIATAAMLTGYFFAVVIASLFINLFLSIDFTDFDPQLMLMIAWFGGLVLFFLILRIPFIARTMNKAIEGMTVRVFKRAAKENFISVLDTYGQDAVANIFLYKVPEFLEGKCIADTDFRKKYNVNILMYTRKGQNHYVTGDTMFSNNDTLIAFGPLSAIRDAFLLKEHNDVPETKKKTSDKEENTLTIMSNFGNQVLSDIKLNKVPAMIEGKSLVDSKIKEYFSINIMMVSRDNKPIKINKDTVLTKGDRVIAFGPYESISTVFGEKKRNNPES